MDDFQKLDITDYENAEESICAIQYSMNDGAILSGFLASSAGHVNWSQLLNTPKGRTLVMTFINQVRTLLMHSKLMQWSSLLTDRSRTKIMMWSLKNKCRWNKILHQHSN